MAKKKTRSKKKSHKRSAGAVAKAKDTPKAEAAKADDEPDDGQDAGADDERDTREDASEGDDQAEAAAEDEDAASAQKKRAPKGRGRGRGTRKGAAPVVDTNIPTPDGSNVSSNGGLYFVGVVLGLIVLAIVAQFFMGE